MRVGSTGQNDEHAPGKGSHGEAPPDHDCDKKSVWVVQNVTQIAVIGTCRGSKAV